MHGDVGRREVPIYPAVRFGYGGQSVEAACLPDEFSAVESDAEEEKGRMKEMELVTTTPVTLQERRRMQDSWSVCRSTVHVVIMVSA